MTRKPNIGTVYLQGAFYVSFLILGASVLVYGLELALRWCSSDGDDGDGGASASTPPTAAWQS